MCFAFEDLLLLRFQTKRSAIENVPDKTTFEPPQPQSLNFHERCWNSFVNLFIFIEWHKFYEKRSFYTIGCHHFRRRNRPPAAAGKKKISKIQTILSEFFLAKLNLKILSGMKNISNPSSKHSEALRKRRALKVNYVTSSFRWSFSFRKSSRGWTRNCQTDTSHKFKLLSTKNLVQQSSTTVQKLLILCSVPAPRAIQIRFLVWSFKVFFAFSPSQTHIACSTIFIWTNTKLSVFKFMIS